MKKLSMTLYDLEKKGLISVKWNKNKNDIDIRVTKKGKEYYKKNIKKVS